MELKVNMVISEDIPAEFKVTFDDQTKILDAIDKNAVFNFDKSGTYVIEFSQQAIDEKFSAMQKIMYLLILPLTGILSFFMLYGESPWPIYKKIHPYLIAQKIRLTVDSDAKLNVRYVPSVFNDKTGCWSKPVLIFAEHDNAEEAIITRNDNAFDNCYLEFKRTFGSAFFVVILFFSILGIIALYRSELAVFTTFILLATILTAVCIITIIFVKNKVKKGKAEFQHGKVGVMENDFS